MTGPQAFVRQPGEGERRAFYGGGEHVWKATAADTGGSLFAFEDVLEEGKLTPLHAHPEADEVSYVLEGEIEVHQDGRTAIVGAGGFSFVPRGTPHAFRVTVTPTRVLALQTPGAGDAFYLGASEPMLAGAPAPVDFARIGRVAAETGSTHMLGAPPFAPA